MNAAPEYPLCGTPCKQQETMAKTMKLRDYYSENDGFIQFSREQASRFAKNVAGDFNPIHDPDSKRFCVPGDLLFACSLANFGLSEKMHVRFSGMVGAGSLISSSASPTARAQGLFAPFAARRFSVSGQCNMRSTPCRKGGVAPCGRQLLKTMVLCPSISTRSSR